MPFSDRPRPPSGGFITDEARPGSASPGAGKLPPAAQNAGRILIVDDDPDNIRLLRAYLTAAGHDDLLTTTDADQAFSMIRQTQPDLILLDVLMPGSSGLEILQQIRSDRSVAHTPVLILTAVEDRHVKRQALELGALDFLSKPLDRAELISRVRNALTIKKHQDELRRHARSLEREVCERLRAEDRLRHLAEHDALTGLPNRSLLIRHLGQAVERARSDPGFQFAVLFLDFDRFKLINDSLGHQIGDRFLIEIARRLEAAAAQADRICATGEVSCLVARMGGDEFVMLVEKAGPQAAICLANYLLCVLSDPYHLAGYEFFSTASIGIVTSGVGHHSPDDLLRDADIAMYRAKAAGGSCHVVFDRHMLEETRAALELEQDLRHALERRELRLVYQPIVSLETTELAGFEALLRWEHPRRGLIEPAQFISLAEEAGLMVAINEWVLEEACRQLRAWAQHPRAKPALVSVNLCPRQLLSPSFLGRLQEIIGAAEIEPKRLSLELAESAIAADPEVVLRSLRELKSLNVRVFVDDFGSGHSALTRLHELPVDAVKVDRTFVASMSKNRQLAAIMHTILSLARNLDIEVIAEGVEEEQQVAQLLALGCNYAQGYYFARPLSSDRATKLMTRPVRWHARCPKLPGG